MAGDIETDVLPLTAYDAAFTCALIVDKLILLVAIWKFGLRFGTNKYRCTKYVVIIRPTYIYCKV